MVLAAVEGDDQWEQSWPLFNKSHLLDGFCYMLMQQDTKLQALSLDLNLFVGFKISLVPLIGTTYCSFILRAGGRRIQSGKPTAGACMTRYPIRLDAWRSHLRSQYSSQSFPYFSQIQYLNTRFGIFDR